MTTREELQAIMDRPGFGTGRAFRDRKAQENEALALLPDPAWMAPVMASTDCASNWMICSFGNSGEDNCDDKPFSTIQGVLKPKDLCMVPNRFAIAMQEWGWWVRSEIIWAKPNPMPESVTDRPATAHEKVFMFSKASRYWYDADAVKIRRKSSENKAVTNWASSDLYRGQDPRNPPPAKPTYKADKQRGHSRRHAGFNDRWDAMERHAQQANGRNLRNYEPAPAQVWEIATRPFSAAHFATFPPELVARCLQASLRPGDAVLDPFGGAGTTGLVADKFGADATLIEINPDYCALIRSRLAAGLVDIDKRAEPTGLGGLFARAAE